MQIMDRLHLEDLFTRAIQSDLHVKFDKCHYMCTWLDSNKMHIVITCHSSKKLEKARTKLLEEYPRIKKYITNMWNVNTIVKEGMNYENTYEARYTIKYRMTNRELNDIIALLKVKGYRYKTFNPAVDLVGGFYD